MRDIDVRTVLAAEVARRYKGDADTLIIHELGVCSGDARIDLAVVNGKLHGYEIKSDADTLKRLPAQAEARLLWRAEALSLLREASLDCGVKSKPREAIYGRLVESFPLGELRRLVRCQLRAREGWRSGPTPFRCGDLSRCSAKSQHSPANRRWLLSLVFSPTAMTG